MFRNVFPKGSECTKADSLSWCWQKLAVVEKGPPYVRALRLAGVLGVAMLASGCRLDVDTTVAFRADDTADVTVSAGFDQVLAGRLDALGVDPFGAFADVSAFGWQLSRSIDEQGLLRLGLTQNARDVGDVGEVLQGLSTGLNATDVGLVFDLRVDTTRNLRLLSGSAVFTPPTNQGVFLDGVALGMSAQALATQIARDVSVWFTVIVDGEIVRHNGEMVTASTVRWRMPVNELVNISVTVDPRNETTGALTAALLVVVLCGGVAWLVWRHRLKRLRQVPAITDENAP